MLDKTRHTIAVDIEATCSEGQKLFPEHEMEIIEIGAVMLDTKMQVVGEFQTFVRPLVHPVLTDFCTKLTSISQSDVDNAPLAGEAFKAMTAWMMPFGAIQWVSWGNYDKHQFTQDCKRYGLSWPFPGAHINGKDIYRQHIHGKKLGLGGALAKLDITPIGIQHRGIDDARNVAQILSKLLGEAPAQKNIPPQP